MSPESLLIIPKGKLASTTDCKHLCGNISCMDSLRTSLRLNVEDKVVNVFQRKKKENRKVYSPCPKDSTTSTDQTCNGKENEENQE